MKIDGKVEPIEPGRFYSGKITISPAK